MKDLIGQAVDRLARTSIARPMCWQIFWGWSNAEVGSVIGAERGRGEKSDCIARRAGLMRQALAPSFRTENQNNRPWQRAPLQAATRPIGHGARNGFLGFVFLRRKSVV